MTTFKNRNYILLLDLKFKKMNTEVVNLQDKYALINAYWHPRIVAELNGQHLKLVKVKGELIWHAHKNEDELFYVVKGELVLLFRSSKRTIKEGEMFIVPKGVEHKPVAHEECWLVLFEPAGTRHTGDRVCEQTVSTFKWL